MEAAFGILLFVLVYGAVAYVIYDDVTGRRPRIRQSPVASATRASTNRATTAQERLPVLTVRVGFADHTSPRLR